MCAKLYNEGAGCFFASAAKGHWQKEKPLVRKQGVLKWVAEAVRFELTEGYQPSTVFKTVALNRSAKPPRLEVRKYTWIFCGHQGISRKKPQKKDYLLHFNHNLFAHGAIKRITH